MHEENKDSELWKAAKKRATFKYHVLIYFIMNIIFWTLWYISLKNNATLPDERNAIPWPVWLMVGWGIGVFFHYRAVYKSRKSLVENEHNELPGRPQV